MTSIITRTRWSAACGVLLCIFAFLVSSAIAQQAAPDYAALKQQGDALFAQNKMEEALPVYEKLSADGNADWLVFSRLGFLVYNKLALSRNPQERKELADRARTALMRARELGDRTALTNSLINNLANGTPAITYYSEVGEADSYMQQAEIIFMKGDLPAAVELYKKAFEADPKLYDAAVYIGDACYKTPGKLEEAQEWYAKAVAINPNRAVAYRYWADDLMKLGKVQEARDKFVEAYISQPTDRLAVAALATWAKGQNITLSQPLVKIPVTIEMTANGYVVTVAAGAINNSTPVKIPFVEQSTPGTYSSALNSTLAGNPTLTAWLKYASGRVSWSKKYVADHPNQTSVRNNLPEETFALRACISQLDANAKDLDPSLATLIKLDKDGVLEAFILLARGDQGIMQDYPAYLTQHRDILRRYVMTWVFPQGGQK
jgi:tetratricopeptide (TPR) repeat protein